MTIHCLEVVTATNYPAADAKSDIQTFRSDHSEVLEAQRADLSTRNTAEDGSGEDHYHGVFRFAWDEDLSALKTQVENWLNNNFDWWAYRYHACDHDESTGGRSGCSWDVMNTSGGGSVPRAVIDHYT